MSKPPSYFTNPSGLRPKKRRSDPPESLPGEEWSDDRRQMQPKELQNRTSNCIAKSQIKTTQSH